MCTARTYLCLLLFVANVTITRAQISDADIKTAYIYRFTDYIEWPNTAKEEFTIGIFSENELIRSKLEYLGSTRSIKGQKVKIIPVTTVKDLKREVFDILYFEPINGVLLIDVLNALQNKSTLLITDNISENESIMINFLPSEREGIIRFEINKKNITDKGLIVYPDILLLGGTFINVRELFQEKEEELEAERKKLEESKREINEKLQIIARQDSLIVEKNLLIDSRNLEIDRQRVQLVTQQNKLDSLINAVRTTQKLLNSTYTTLNVLKSDISNYNEQIAGSEEKITEQNKKLALQEADLQEQQQKLNEQSNLLVEQFTKIQLQRNLIIGSIIIVILVLSLVYFIYRGLKTRKRNNDTLRALNNDLSYKNEIIESQNAELKATLQNLRETQAQLFQAEKMASLGILTAGVAHEINNPLNYIMGAYTALVDYFEETDVEDRDYINTLLNSLNEGVERASNIVLGLNEFSRSNPAKEEDCDIHAIIDNCLRIINNALIDRIEVIKQFHPEKLTAKGNVGKLHQVIINLLTNASQAIPDKGTIHITTTHDNQSFTIKIADSGVGISPENLNKITDPFFTTKAPGEGTGLGLSISYNIINEHNGKLQFESEEGKGTTATITLPCNKN